MTTIVGGATASAVRPGHVRRREIAACRPSLRMRVRHRASDQAASRRGAASLGRGLDRGGTGAPGDPPLNREHDTDRGTDQFDDRERCARAYGGSGRRQRPAARPGHRRGCRQRRLQGSRSGDRRSAAGGARGRSTGIRHGNVERGLSHNVRRRLGLDRFNRLIFAQEPTGGTTVVGGADHRFIVGRAPERNIVDRRGVVRGPDDSMPMVVRALSEHRGQHIGQEQAPPCVSSTREHQVAHLILRLDCISQIQATPLHHAKPSHPCQ